MKRFTRLPVRVLWLLIALAPCLSAAKTLEPLPHYEYIAKSLHRRLPHEHLLGVPLEDEMSRRAWSNYIAVLDYDRSYFLASDIARFRAYEDQLDDMLRIGDLRFAFDVFEVYKQRLRERVAYVEALLAQPFDLERDESYMWKRWANDLAWPVSADAQDDLWRKRIKNEYIRIVLAREAREDKATSSDADRSTTLDVISTNALTGVMTNDVTSVMTNDVMDSIVEDTPEQSIIKRYHQTLTVLEDSDAEWVLQNYMSSVTQAYDPHSGFMSPSSAEDFQIEMKLSLMGIGALLRAEDGAAKIVRLIPGGPADRDSSENRLEPGDKIIAVAQGTAAAVDIIHWPLHKTVRLIRGEKGTTVVLTVVPKSDPTGATTKKVSLVRGEVKLDAQAAKSAVYHVPNSNGETQALAVITLPAFYANMKVSSENHPDFRSASHDVATLIEALATNHISGLVLDLRNNGGGSLLEAVQMSGLFVPHGPVVQIKSRGRHARILRDEDHGIAFDGPMIVLVNRLSASASEILAGALQDYGRAVIVGDSRTHGKGTVQTVLDLGRDAKLGQLKVTSASYHRINGASTQLRGISSDVLLPSPWGFTETGEEFLRNPLPWSRLTPAPYSRMSDLAPIIERVDHLSKQRRAGDERFQVYMSLLQRVTEMTQRESRTLNLEQRRLLNAAERELEDLQQKLMEEQAGVGEDEPLDPLAKDLVLSETLNILNDMIHLNKGLVRPARSTPTKLKRTGDPLIDWLRSGF